MNAHKSSEIKVACAIKDYGAARNRNIAQRGKHIFLTFSFGTGRVN
jgi:hypothetical protein